MQPQTQNGVTGSTKKRDNKLLLTVVFVVAVALALVLGFWYGRDKNSSSSSTTSSTQTYKLSYSGLSTYQFNNLTASGGMSFKKPSTIGKDQGAESQGTQLALSQTSSSGNVNLADITAMTVSPGDAAITKLKKSTIQNLTDRQNYANFLLVQPAEKLIDSTLDPAYGFSFNAPKNFSDSAITSDAWSISFSASSLTSNPNLPPMQGAIVIAIGKTSVYYFIVNAVNYNWTNNQSVWQQVFDSFKIDQ